MWRKTLSRGVVHSRRFDAGFTLIELVVVVSIMIVISSIVLVSYSKFGGTILLRNLTYDVALTIREAQLYGISGRSALGAPSSSGHGVYFDTGAGNDFFYLFIDTDTNGIYNSAATEWIETYTIEKNYSIASLCVQSGPGPEDCTMNRLSILFRRPEPDAIIYASDGGAFAPYSSARIVIRSPRGDTMSALVESTGQISVSR